MPALLLAAQARGWRLAKYLFQQSLHVPRLHWLHRGQNHAPRHDCRSYKLTGRSPEQASAKANSKPPLKVFRC